MVIVNFDKQTIEEIDRRQARQNQGEKKRKKARDSPHVVQIENLKKKATLNRSLPFS